LKEIVKQEIDKQQTESKMFLLEKAISELNLIDKDLVKFKEAMKSTTINTSITTSSATPSTTTKLTSPSITTPTPYSHTDCPAPEILTPCICDNDTNQFKIICGGSEQLSLKDIFFAIKEYNKQHKYNNKYDLFQLQNTAITELEEDVFDSVHFEIIKIVEADNLTRIHKNAFTSVSSSILNFEVSSSKLNNFPGTDYDLWKAMSSLTHATRINLYLESIKEIPDKVIYNIGLYIGFMLILLIHFKAFDSILKFKLEYLYIGAIELDKIGGNAFAQLTNLVEIDIFVPSLSKFPANVFDFNEPSERNLVISFRGNSRDDLTKFSFEVGFLSNAKRHVKLLLKFHYSVYLDEKIFGPILKDKRYEIDLYESPLNCKDCKMYWMIRDNLSNLVSNAKCDDGQSFWNSSLKKHWDECKK
jgi:hypothetical protein